jgi:hypothetical protein
MTDTQMNEDHRLLPQSYSTTYFTQQGKYNMEWSYKKTSKIVSSFVTTLFGFI